jgi:hypothetical protein
MDRAATRTYSAILAASSSLASKHAVLRVPPPATLPRHLQSHNLNEVPRLLSEPTTGRAAREARVARAMVAATHYSLAKKRTHLTAQLLDGEAEKVLKELEAHHDREQPKQQHRARSPQRQKANRTCRYCTIFNAMLYGSDPSNHPFEVVNHSAHVRASFDPDVNIASAGIGVDGDDDPPFQVLVPEDIAKEMVRLAHPLAWPLASPDLFQETAQVRRRPGRWEIDRSTLDPIERVKAWQAERDPRYLYEWVSWPWNDQAKAEIENILRIDGFKYSDEADEVSMQYEYSLEECQQTSFGLGIERSGLDIDAGQYQGVAKRVFRGEKVLISKADVRHLTRRDLVHMDLLGDYEQLSSKRAAGKKAPTNRNLQALAQGWSSAENALDPDLARQALAARARKLSEDWRGRMRGNTEYWLVSLGASKRLRFTTPVEGPPELWGALTWTAPALLFMFINRGTCQLPHFLLDSVLQGKQPLLTAFPKPSA